MNKKEAKHAQGHTDSAIIADLQRAVEDLASGRKKPGELEGMIADAKVLAREWKDPQSAKNPRDRRPLFGETSNPTTFLLAALVVAFRRDHELLESIRRHRSNELEKLSKESFVADVQPGISAWAAAQPKPKRWQKYELERRRWHRSSFDSIEYQFGGAAEAEWKKRLHALPLPYEPTCLDNIFAWETINMQRLEDLFYGIERHRLGEALEGFQKRRYDYLAVVKIMHFLLKKPRRKRKQSEPGRPPRKPWLNDADLRTRVLTGIEARITSITSELRENNPDVAETWQKEIAAAFLAVVRSHLPESGKK